MVKGNGCIMRDIINTKQSSVTKQDVIKKRFNRKSFVLLVFLTLYLVLFLKEKVIFYLNSSTDLLNRANPVSVCVLIPISGSTMLLCELYNRVSFILHVFRQVS